MKSFFSRLQSHFKQKDGGRYLGIILCEIALQCPDILSDLFANGHELARQVKKGMLAPTAEWRFSGSKRNGRIADLALLDLDGNCHALLEIKVEDNELEGQFADYRDYVRRTRVEQGRTVAFTLLCKYFKPSYLPSAVDREIQNTVGISSFARRLKVGKFKNNYVISLFVDYIKDMGIMFTDVSNDDLRMLLRRLLHERKGGGRMVSKDNIGTRIPEAFSGIINNQFAISESLRSLLGKYGAKVDFSLELERSGKTKADHDYVTKEGGYLKTFTWVPLVTHHKNSDWLYLYYGVYYSLADNKPRISAYACIEGKQIRPLIGPDEELLKETTDRSFRTNYSPDKLSVLMSSCIRDAVDQALQVRGLPALYKTELSGVKKLLT